ncbi:MAG: rhomboid family intramembrane serine protease [Oscillospiraceae bacterium]|jgi:hypothetical protein|nr:rhomboid family intramembrane serine protease [Oscillospiraceae bacterium]
MKPIQKAIARFVARHPRFGVPRLMLYIAILQMVALVLSRMETTGTFLDVLRLNPELIMHGEVWRLISWLAIPLGGDVIWAAIGAAFFYYMGRLYEQSSGTGKFTIFYLSGVALTIIFAFVARYAFGVTEFYGASYLNLSIIVAVGIIVPDAQIRLYFIPLTMKWLAIIDLAFSVYTAVSDSIGSGSPFYAVQLVVSLLNVVLIVGLPKPRVLATAKHAKFRAEQTINAAAARARHTHKCVVCGRTDTSNPELEFRYCSKCAGYLCYCEDHIGEHEHVGN